MMIYPAEVESAYDYPYNILQSHYILSLMYANRIIAIGHRFGDINISLPIKALLEKPNFELTLVSPTAEEIKKEVFNNHSNAEAISDTIENWMPEGIEEVRSKIENFHKKRKEEAEKARKERVELEERIREETEARLRPTISVRGLTTQPIDVLGSMISLDPSTITLGPQYTLDGVVVCPSCIKLVRPTALNKCPYCGHDF